jgi:hypothetical protein
MMRPLDTSSSFMATALAVSSSDKISGRFGCSEGMCSTACMFPCSGRIIGDEETLLSFNFDDNLECFSLTPPCAALSADIFPNTELAWGPSLASGVIFGSVMHVLDLLGDHLLADAGLRAKPLDNVRLRPGEASGGNPWIDRSDGEAFMSEPADLSILRVHT